MTLTFRSLALGSVLAAASWFVAAPSAFAAAAETNQAKLIAVLQSDSPAADKAITCKLLAVYGNQQAVPALAPLLANPELASWARIALEAIPHPSADAALRDALGKLEGPLLVGVINSIGVRRDPDAIRGLVAQLKAADLEVVSAAAEALGQIGTIPAAKAVGQALVTVPEGIRSEVAYGCIIGAERLMAAGQLSEAARLYDAVRQANVSKQRVLEATRGAILAQQSAGLPLLLEQLRSTDKARFGIGLRAARELPGTDVTEALAQEMGRLSSDWQLLLFLAIADRKDAAVLPKVLQVAQSGLKPIRAVALSRLDQFHDPACVPVLFKAVAEGDPDLIRPAKTTLARMEGKQVDTELLAQLPQSTGRLRQVLIELVAQRRIQEALPAVVSSTDDSDPGVRRAALDTIAVLGTQPQIRDLVQFLSKDQSDQDREQAERALTAVAGRTGPQALPSVLPLTKNSSAALRRLALRVVASIGGPDALAVVTTALKDADESVQDEAVSTLATWPNNWPEDTGVAAPLLNLVKSGTKVAHHVQGVRGYLHYVQEDKKLNDPEKLAKINELMPLLKRAEEKRLAIAALSTIPTAGSLEQLITLAGDTAVAEEACLAITKLATDTHVKGLSKALRQQALQTSAEKSKNDATRKKAEEGLKQLQ